MDLVTYAHNAKADGLINVHDCYKLIAAIQCDDVSDLDVDWLLDVLGDDNSLYPLWNWLNCRN